MSEAGAPRHPLRMLFLVQLPPPIHGVTVVSDRVLRTADAIPGVIVHHLWAGGARGLTDIGRVRVRKLANFSWLLAKLSGMRFSATRYDIAYCALAPHGEALLRDALLIGAAKKIAKRVLVHLHTRGLDEIMEGRTVLQRTVCKLIAGSELIALSEEMRDLAERSGRFSRVHRLRNCVADPGDMPMKRSGRLRCGFLGNLDPRKGVLRFVDAVAALNEAGIAAEGVIIGASTKHLRVEDVRTYAETKDVSALIETFGFVDEKTKSALLGSLDIFIYLSDHDLAPLVLLESLAHANVPIVFDTGALREIVGSAFKENVISEKADCEAYLGAIVEIARRYSDDPQSLTEKKRAARSRYLEAFSAQAFGLAVARIIHARSEPDVGIRAPRLPRAAE